MEKELPTLPQHLSSPPVFSGVRVTRSLVLCVCFVDRCLSSCPLALFLFGHCVVCPSIYDSDYPFCIFKLFLYAHVGIISSNSLGTGEDSQCSHLKGCSARPMVADIGSPLHDGC